MEILMKVTCKNGQYVGREIPIEPEEATVQKRKPRKPRLPEIKLFDQAFEEISAQGLSGDNLRENVQILLMNDDRYESIAEPAADALWIDEECQRCEFNEYQRQKRFKKKAYMNGYNYFVTFTYDDKKTSKRAFEKGIKKALENLTYTHGWRYQGCPEEGEEGGRLHYHYLIKIPKRASGMAMPGYLYARGQFSTKRHRYEFVTSNSFFDKFGNNEFKAIEAGGQDYYHAVNYITKYLGKGGHRAIYSRNTAEECVMVVDTETDVMFCRFDHGKTYLLYGCLFHKSTAQEDDAFVIEVDELIDWSFVNPPYFLDRKDELGYLCELVGAA